MSRWLHPAAARSAYLVARIAQGDGILISADRSPNVRGALVTGLINTLPDAKLSALAQGIDTGQIKTILAINEDLAAAGLTAEQLAKVTVIYVGTHANASSEIARVILPAHTVFEKSGTFINQQFRLQKFSAAIPGLAGTANDLAILTKLLSGVGGATLPGDVAALWPRLASEISILAGVTFAKLPEVGLLLNSADFANLNFSEGESLHYQPAVKAAAVSA
jgi:NADH-quinone oxidoreductase subunit G